MDKENSIAQKAVRLRDRLSQKGKFLIILDDIWEKIDLESLGIPFDDNHPKIKLLLTSRSEQILRSKMDSEHNFHLEPLRSFEAVDLFKQILGNRALKEATLIDQLANECAGFPVLISLLATSLKSLSSSTWHKALDKLRESNKLGIENIIDESMKLSYDLIETKEAKSLFLLCGQIGAQIIQIDYLMTSGMALGLLKGVYRMEDAREKVKLLLDNLKACCLLEDYGKGFVKIHDLMGDAALSIASKTCTSLVIRNGEMLKAHSEDDLKRCKAMSMNFLGDIIHELPKGLICPELEMLLVFVYASNCNLRIPDAFFENIRKLKILHLSRTMSYFLPSSIQLLNELHSLILDGVMTKDIKIIGKLKTLQVLNISGSEISRIPKEIGELKDLRFLSLAGCYNLKVIEPTVLGNLIQMEELYLPRGFDGWDAEGASNASLTELNNMSRLSTLNICVPDATSLTNSMPFQQLVRYKIYIGNMWNGAVGFGEERTLRLELESSSSKLIVKELLQKILNKTQDLCLYGWIGFEESFTELSKDGFPELKHVRVENSPSIKYIIRSKQPNAVLVLESLFLCCLTNLQKICQGGLPPKPLNNLKVMKIERCDNLRNLFSSSLAKDLPNLEEIEVSDCEMIQEIITYDEMDSTNVKEVIAVDKFELLEWKCLRKLKLNHLRNFSSFCSKGNKEIVEDDDGTQFELLNGCQVSFPCLESLTLRELPKLKKISHDKCPVKLHGLKSLELYKCDSLLYAVDASFLLQLKNLELLTIECCESMETVFNQEHMDVNGTNLNDQHLNIKLKLSNLSKLKALWNKSPKDISNVLKLETLEVYGCGKLEYLFSSTMAKSLENITQISLASCMTMTEIFLEEENGVQEIKFSSLSSLSISNMENLAMFSRGNHHYCFPSLTELMIFSCPKMWTFVSMKHEKEAIDATKNAFSFFNQKAVLPNLEKLVLHSLSMINIWDNNLSEESFYKLASIEIENCARILLVFPSHLLERLQKLTKAKVESCELLEDLFAYGHRKLIMCKLQEIKLLGLPKLRHIVLKSQSSREATLSFPSLRDIFVENCHNLISLFPYATAKGLSELVNMYISSCEDLEEVISFDGKEGDMALIEAMIFHNLSSLQLRNLSSLVHFCSGHYELYFPFLKKLSIIECMKLKAFIQRSPNLVKREERLQHTNLSSDIEVDISPLFDEKVIFPNLQELEIKGLEFKEIWPRHGLASFQTDLKKLIVEDCHQLSIIIPSLMLPNLHSFESLSVKSCNALEVVFKHENYRRKVPRSNSPTKVLERLRELTVTSCALMQHIVVMRDDDCIEDTCHKTVIFPQLSSLELFELPTLDTFFHKNHKIELPSFAKLEIKNCALVETLVADSSQHCKPLLLVEKVEFPKMESLVVADMKRLTKLCHISKEDTECSSEVFCQLKTLQVTHCDVLLTVFPSKMIKAFHNLTVLIVTHCKSLESVFESTATSIGLGRGIESNNTGDVAPTTFALRMLELSELPGMKHVWNAEDPRWIYFSFENIYFIDVSRCHSLKHLFPISVARFLHQMYELRIMDCEGMEGIVWNEESAQHQLFSGSTLESTYNFSCGLNSLEWPSLERLRLQKIPKAKIFASLQQKVSVPRLRSLGMDASTLKNQQFLDEIHANPARLTLRNIKNGAWVECVPWLSILNRFPSLIHLRISQGDSKDIFLNSDSETEGTIVSCKPGILDIAKILEIRECHHLTILPPFVALFHNLIDLEVSSCHGLQHLVTSSVASGLVQLTKLEIHECNNLKEIVTCDYDKHGNRVKDDSAAMISFPRLKKLELYDLPSLWSFSFTNCNFSFPSLRTVYMENLPMIFVFCEGGFTTPYKHRIMRFLVALRNNEINECLICPGT